MQQIRGRHAERIQARMVGDQPYPLSMQFREIPPRQEIDPSLPPCVPLLRQMFRLCLGAECCFSAREIRRSCLHLYSRLIVRHGRP